MEELLNSIDNNGNLSDHPLLVTASETDNDLVLYTAAKAIITAQEVLKNSIDNLHFLADKTAVELNEEDIEIIAALASEFENSGDEVLEKQASVLDQVLINFAQQGTLQEAKKRAEEEIDRIRKQYREESLKNKYEEPKKAHEKDIKASEATKQIEDQIKRYRPLEASLSTRYCPDHPGVQVTRVADGIVQCELDKKMYNFREGYTTMKGNSIPGGDVQEQTRNFSTRPIESMTFSTRESRLQQNK